MKAWVLMTADYTLSSHEVHGVVTDGDQAKEWSDKGYLHYTMETKIIERGIVV